nr:tryptorubin family RiPP precursor [Streptomyces hygroscopicus]
MTEFNYLKGQLCSAVIIRRPIKGSFPEPPTRDLHGLARDDTRHPAHSRGGAVMKLLFAIRNKVAASKSLKANAWYIWY